MSIVKDIIEKEWLPEERKITTFLDWSGVSPRYLQIYPTSSQEWVINRVDSNLENELMSEREWSNFRSRVVKSDFLRFDHRKEIYHIFEEDIDSWLERYGFDYKPWRDEWVLRRLKYKLHYSDVIAEELGCGRGTVQRWCREHKIMYPWRSEQLLRELYSDRGLNKLEIAEYLNCGEGTIAKWLSEHDIATRRENRAINRDHLRSLFIEQNLSIAECGRRLGCSAGKVRYWVEKYNLEQKEQKTSVAVKYQSHKGYPCWIPKSEDSAVRVRVHRLAAVAEWGLEGVKGMSVHHRSEIPWDNRLSNLELVSNEKHAKLHNSNYE